MNKNLNTDELMEFEETTFRMLDTTYINENYNKDEQISRNNFDVESVTITQQENGNLNFQEHVCLDEYLTEQEKPLKTLKAGKRPLLSEDNLETPTKKCCFSGSLSEEEMKTSVSTEPHEVFNNKVELMQTCEKAEQVASGLPILLNRNDEQNTRIATNKPSTDNINNALQLFSSNGSLYRPPSFPTQASQQTIIPFNPVQRTLCVILPKPSSDAETSNSGVINITDASTTIGKSTYIDQNKNVVIGQALNKCGPTIIVTNMTPCKHLKGNNELKPLLPKPYLSIRKTEKAITVYWTMPYNLNCFEPIFFYQLYVYEESNNSNTSPDMWRKIGDMKPLALPMACTFTHFVCNRKYYFSVRAIDVHRRIGAFSDPWALYS